MSLCAPRNFRVLSRVRHRCAGSYLSGVSRHRPTALEAETDRILALVKTSVTTELRDLRHIRIGALSVEVVRKDIKNLHLGVYPPNGRVRVAAPLVVDDDAVRLAMVEKLGWIKRQKAKFAEQPR